MSSADKAQANIDQAKANAEKQINEVKHVADRNLNKAKDNASQAKKTFLQKLEDDGVVNPGGLAMLGFSGVFFAFVPVTSWLAQPNGLLEKAVNGVISSVAYVSSAGATATVAPANQIAALSALYLAVTYAISGAGSAAATTAGNKDGRDNNAPRAQNANLTGLPLRLWSGHHHLVEFFPSWAVVAALTQINAPNDRVLLNLLGLHVISKVFVHYPSYIFNVGATRSLGHVVATASVINVALRLAKQPLLAL